MPAGKTVPPPSAPSELERLSRLAYGTHVPRGRLGRPKVVLDVTTISDLRSQGLGWKRIASQLNCGVGTVLRVVEESKPQ